MDVELVSASTFQVVAVLTEYRLDNLVPPLPAWFLPFKG